MVNHVQLDVLGWQSLWGGPEVGTLLLKQALMIVMPHKT